MEAGNDQYRSEHPGYGQSPYGQSPYAQAPYPQSPYPQSPYPQSPYGASAPGAPGYGGRQGTPVRGAPARGRPGLIVLTSFLVQLLTIAAVGNQGVTRPLSSFGSRHPGVLGGLVRSLNVFAWRFTPLDRDSAHVFEAQLAGLATFFLIAALLTFAVVRGPITFGRALVGVWMSVIVAVFADGMVQRAVLTDFGRNGAGGKVVGVLFGSSGFELMAGVMLGFGAGLVAALVAVLTRRSPAGAPAPFQDGSVAERDPDAPPPFFGDEERARHADPDAARSLSMHKVQQSVGDRDGAAPGDDQPTRRLSAPEQTWTPPGASARPADDGPPASDATTQLPRSGAGDTSGHPSGQWPRADQQAAPDAAGTPAADPDPPRRTSVDEPTAAFPRPPDDEELGHHPE